MNDSVYLTFDRKGVKSPVRKTPPSLRAGEYAVRIDLKVDDKYFKRIIPIAKMELDDSQIIDPKVELEVAEKPDDINEDDYETRD